ncbi:MAG TPA: hypothetical protein VGK64_05595 [Bryobacteraceae bacterium]
MQQSNIAIKDRVWLDWNDKIVAMSGDFFREFRVVASIEEARKSDQDHVVTALEDWKKRLPPGAEEFTWQPVELFSVPPPESKFFIQGDRKKTEVQAESRAYP